MSSFFDKEIEDAQTRFDEFLKALKNTKEKYHQFKIKSQWLLYPSTKKSRFLSEILSNLCKCFVETTKALMVIAEEIKK
jgi:hypothetical protein